jgi:hypothetical protein
LANPNDLLKIKVGSGLGDYEGWYVCNGKTWKGTIDHIVPDLNSFSYNIGDNINSIDLNSQGSAVVTNPETHIMGGADLSMTATNVAPGIYGVGSTITTTPHVSIDTTSGGSIYKIKRLPQIIYLGEGGCYWQDAGTGQARTFLDLVKSIFKSLDLPEHINFRDTPEDIRDKYQYFTEADMHKLLDAGFNKTFNSLEEGIDIYVNGFLKEHKYL